MIPENEYKKRRKKVAQKLQPYSVAIICAAPLQQRSNDTEYPYRQNSNFYYLIGLKEDSSYLMILKRKKAFQTVLFVAKKDPQVELWNGKRLGVKAAKKCFDVDAVYENEVFKEELSKALVESKHLYYDFSMECEITNKQKTQISHIHNLAPTIEKLRLVKSKNEIALIKKALSITKEAHHKAMQKVANLTYEYELQAEIEYIFKKNGAYSDAYTSIVACGENANTLHYINNNQKLRDGELILIDAGCEYEYYASDVTRTIPRNGRFTKSQKELYELVLDVQLHIISMIKPGVLRSELQKEAVLLLTRGMKKLGIIQISVKKAIKNELYKRYCPHGIGHWMGLDVHDQAPYKTAKGKEIALQEGMILTIEPGIYLPQDDTKIPNKYRGIGIRIEDDILVTSQGCENLSAAIAKSVEEIERCCGLES